MRIRRGRLRDGAFVLAVVLVAGTGDAAPASAPVRNARVVDHAAPRPLDLPAATRAPAPGSAAWAPSLRPIEVVNRNTNARAKLRLYTDDGVLDRAALRAFMRVACSTPDAEDAEAGDVAEPLAPRVVKLAVRAAYHFGGVPILIVSATRKGSHGKHGTGDALDFRLEGVRAATLAAYARSYSLAGVGVYTHPKTQYVHVDVRDRSYHWIDGSPPGVTWREKRLSDPAQSKRDAAWTFATDLPEVASVKR